MNSHRKTPEGKALYKRRQETVERSFADAKTASWSPVHPNEGLTARKGAVPALRRLPEREENGVAVV